MDWQYLEFTCSRDKYEVRNLSDPCPIFQVGNLRYVLKYYNSFLRFITWYELKIYHQKIDGKTTIK